MSAQPGSRAKMHRQPSALEEVILYPGAVRINVQGAFIQEPSESDNMSSDSMEDGVQHDTQDIRLPNHKAVVSHVALDVRPK